MIRRRCWFCEQEMPETVMTVNEATGNWFCTSSKACDARYNRMLNTPLAGLGDTIGDGRNANRGRHIERTL